jgi:single-strand DNA-binding protein
MNRYTAVANLTRDPELRQLPDGRSVCDLRVAVNNGRDQAPTYIDVATFDKAADACAEYLSKGRQVSIDGRLVLDEWEAEDGSKRSKHKVIGRVGFLGNPNGNGSKPQAEAGSGEGTTDEDIPF